MSKRKKNKSLFYHVNRRSRRTGKALNKLGRNKGRINRRS